MNGEEKGGEEEGWGEGGGGQNEKEWARWGSE